ncbi:hypothetical protein [Rufibacter sp. LB8]|uniref:hypothetical protein n=1 Tax=Rufibacter sp. LB8 TaxID=2777781 RepID=UPI00178C2F40|nr:hypothetical protein [Rufibacter sp. LB8]
MTPTDISGSGKIPKGFDKIDLTLRFCLHFQNRAQKRKVSHQTLHGTLFCLIWLKIISNYRWSKKIKLLFSASFLEMRPKTEALPAQQNYVPESFGPCLQKAFPIP